MKPISVRFKAFGPYLEEQFVSFEELGSMFVISGETGAGKTTILDTICYALYGESSSGKRGSLQDMRCTSATKDQPTVVEFIFEEHGKQYKFTRSLRYARKNLNDEYGCAELAGGDWKPLMANPKQSTVTKKAVELLNLNSEQFRQIIILPQGKFEDFLVSNEETKETILKTIFGMERWETIAKTIKASVVAEEKKLGEDKSALRAKLDNYSCATVGQLEEKKLEEEAGLQLLTKEEKTASETYVKADAALQKGIAEYADFEEYDRRQAEVNRLDKKKDDYAKERELLKNASAAEACRPLYEERARNRTELAARQTENTKKQNTLIAKNKQLEDKTAVMAALEAKRPQAKQAEDENVRLENAKKDYLELDRQRAEADKAKSVADKAEKQKASAEKAAKQAQKSWETAAAEVVIAKKKTAETLLLYLNEIGSELAEHLAEGKPCPVCGSISHPSPAIHSEEHVTKEQYDEIAAEEQRKINLEQENRKVLDQANETLRLAVENCAKATSEKEKTAAVLEQSLKKQLEGISSLEELENKLAKNLLALERWNKQLKDGQAALELAQKEATAAKTAAETAETEEKNAAEKSKNSDSAWEKCLAESPFTTEQEFLACCMSEEERSDRNAALTEFYTKLSDAKKRLETQTALLEGRSRPELEQLRAEKNTAEASKTQLGKELDKKKELLEKMTQDIRNFTVLSVKLAERDVSIARNKLFAQRLCGEKGVGLQTYVLSTMMDLITQEANRFLRDIYGGRYRLHRTDEKVGSEHKAGLNLVVEDKEALGENNRRLVNSLSGGEKFLVSLSLALGLSAVVQSRASGVRMEAMFVDEGFGSLHASAVDDALNILNHVKKGKGTVGIITHVDRVVSNISNGLEAVKTTNGSTLKKI